MSAIQNVEKIFTKFRIFKLRLLLRLFGIKISVFDFKECVFNQTVKGFAKYKQTIIDCNKNSYDWKTMATEEIIDFYLYTLKNKGKI